MGWLQNCQIWKAAFPCHLVSRESSSIPPLHKPLDVLKNGLAHESRLLDDTSEQEIFEAVWGSRKEAKTPIESDFDDDDDVPGLLMPEVLQAVSVINYVSMLARQAASEEHLESAMGAFIPGGRTAVGFVRGQMHIKPEDLNRGINLS